MGRLLVQQICCFLYLWIAGFFRLARGSACSRPRGSVAALDVFLVLPLFFGLFHGVVRKVRVLQANFVRLRVTIFLYAYLVSLRLSTFHLFDQEPGAGI